MTIGTTFAARRLELMKFVRGSFFDDVGVARQNFIAMRNDTLQRTLVGNRFGLLELELRSHFLDFGQAKETQHLNVAPAQVEFVPLGRKFSGCAIGVMIVMQFFAANNDAPR